MKYKLFFLLFFYACTTSINAQKSYAPSDFKDVKNEGHITHVINPDQVLSPKEEYNLNAKLDSIYADIGIDISIVLFTNMHSSVYETSEKFAAGLQTYWYTANQDNSLIIVYHQQKNDYGYYLGKSLSNSHLSSILVETKEDIFQLKTAKKKASYTLITQKLMSEIEKFAEEETVRQNKIVLDQEAQREKSKPIDIVLTIVTSIGTIVGLYFWTNRKRRMAQRNYTFIEEARAYLNNKSILISFSFFFLSPLVYAIICLSLDIEPADTEYLTIVAAIFMVFGWIPTILFMQIQKSKLINTMPSREYPTTQQNSGRDSLRSLNDSLTGLNNVIQSIQRARQATPEQARSNQREIRQQNDSPKININTATSSQIRELSPLLTVLESNRIIQEREKNGDYSSLRDLQLRTNLSVNLIDVINSKVTFEPSSKSSDKARGRTVDF